MKASETKKGHVIRWKDDLWKVVAIQHITQGNKRAHFQMNLKNLAHGRVLNNRFAAHEDIEFVAVDSRPMQYLYRDGNLHVFMDSETFEQVHVAEEDIAEEIKFLKLNAELRVQFVDDKPISLDLPTAVTLEVVETDPGTKGDSVSNVFKPAKLETGLEVKVPLHINQGELVKVDTRTGEFLERAGK